MKLLLSSLLVLACLAENYTLNYKGEQTAQMFSSTASKCPSFSLGFSTCGDANRTQNLGTDPSKIEWRRAGISWSGAETPTANTWTCWVCFDADTKSSIKEGDSGVGVCYNGTAQDPGTEGQFAAFGTIEAVSAKSFKQAEDNGWDDSFKALETLDSAGNYIHSSTHNTGASGSLYSLDLEDDGKVDFLGLPAKSEVLTKCFCTGGLSSQPDWTEEVDLDDWTTEDGKFLNLEQYINSAHSTWLTGIFALVGAYALLC